MKVLEPGHIYQLEGKNGTIQTLTFFKDIPTDDYPDCHDGILCQEVLRALIDRIIYLNNQVPCEESEEILGHLRQCLYLFEIRAARRFLEKNFDTIEKLPVDERGHVLTLCSP